MSSASKGTASMAANSEVVPKFRGLSLRSNFSWTLVGNVIYAGCQWAMLIVIAKFGNPVMVGQFALGLAVTAPVIMLSNLQLRAIQATDAREDYLFRDYLSLRLIMTALAFIAISGIAFVTKYRLETALVVLIIGLAKSFESISDVFYGLLQQSERMDRIAKSMVLKGSISLLALSAGIYFGGSIVWGAVGLALAWALTLISYDIRSALLILRGSSPTIPDEDTNCVAPKTLLKPRWSLKTLKSLFWLALPLGIVMMLVSLNINIPRYFIQHYFGERELGMYAAMAYIIVAGNTVIQALGHSASPRLAKHYASGDKKAFHSLLLKLIGIGVLLSVTGVVIATSVGKEILSLLYKPEYANRADVFTWLMVAAGISYISSLLGHGMTAARYFKIQLPLNIAFVVITVLAALLLIPLYGLQGAAWASCIAFAAQLPLKGMVIQHALTNVPEHSRSEGLDRSSNPIRVLHVIGGLNKGGVETWLVQFLREVDRKKFHIDILVHTSDKCAYDDEVKTLGSAIIPCLSPSHPWQYAKNFKRIIQEHGPYDVVHSHVHHFSGFVVFLASLARVPMRIVHSRNSADRANAGFLRRCYSKLMDFCVKQYATDLFAVSKAAANGLFGEGVVSNDQYKIVRSSIDLTPFELPVDRKAIRSALGVSADAKVIGHIGRFVPQKNQSFLINIAGEVLRRQPKAVLLFIGEGPLQPEAERMVANKGIADRVIFAGVRSNIPQVLLGAIDVFVLPSLWEGLPRVLVEAQAAGVRCVISDSITDEADLVRPLVTRVSLSQPSSAWAQEIEASLAKTRVISQPDALAVIKSSPFNIVMGARELEYYYRGDSDDD